MNDSKSAVRERLKRVAREAARLTPTLLKSAFSTISSLENIAQGVRNFPTRVSTEVLRERDDWEQVIIHKSRYTEGLPRWIAVPLLCGPVKGKLRCPPELTILLVHNYDREPLMAESLRYAGVDDFVTLRPEGKGKWHHTLKLKAILEYLRGGRCETEYVLFVDSADAVLRNAPKRAVELLREAACDLLISRTQYVGDYEYMPDVKQWVEKRAREEGCPGYYMNTGVYVARAEFLQEALEAAMDYIPNDELTWPELKAHIRGGTVYEALPEFPRGCGNDQSILRYVHPQFYPRMQIDYAGKLALRA